MIRPLLTYPDPRLKTISKPVDQVDDAIRALMDDMVETMLAHDGCGLAAPQIGVHKRVIVIDLSYKDPDLQTLYMANPTIRVLGHDTYELNDGCLSVPQQRGLLKRAKNIQIHYLNRDNEPVTQEVDDLLAFAVQHEIDHLDGILYIDRLSPLKRQMILRRLKKQSH